MMNRCTHCHKLIWFWQKALIDSGSILHVVNCVHDFYGWAKKPRKDVKNLCDSLIKTNKLKEDRMKIYYEDDDLIADCEWAEKEIAYNTQLDPDYYK